MISRILRPMRSICLMWFCVLSRARIATPPWYIPLMSFLLYVFLADVVTIRYPFLKYDRSCGIFVPCMDAICIRFLRSSCVMSLAFRGYAINRAYVDDSERSIAWRVFQCGGSLSLFREYDLSFFLSCDFHLEFFMIYAPWCGVYDFLAMYIMASGFTHCCSRCGSWCSLSSHW